VDDLPVAVVVLKTVGTKLSSTISMSKEPPKEQVVVQPLAELTFAAHGVQRLRLTIRSLLLRCTRARGAGFCVLARPRAHATCEVLLF
jgi:hypothetical protein